MFTVSAKSAYGLSAVLAFALRANEGPVQIKSVAEDCDIPRHYLEQILVRLKQAGIMTSYRGANGGYVLAKDPSGITVYDVLKCLEGNRVLVADPGDFPALKLFWETAQRKIEEIFDVTIDELVLENQKLENRIMFHI